MICTTIREGQECAFMTKKGCGYTDGKCVNIVEQCTGCNRAVEFSTGWYCTAAPEPELKWKSGRCNMATHVVDEAAAAGKKINPIKASKRASGKKKK